MQNTPLWPVCVWSVLAQAEWKCIMQRDAVFYISSILQIFYLSSPKATVLGGI